MLIFALSEPGRGTPHQAPAGEYRADDIPAALRRKSPPLLPEVSELDTVRHYTRRVFSKVGETA